MARQISYPVSSVFVVYPCFLRKIITISVPCATYLAVDKTSNIDPRLTHRWCSLTCLISSPAIVNILLRLVSDVISEDRLLDHYLTELFSLLRASSISHPPSLTTSSLGNK